MPEPRLPTPGRVPGRGVPDGLLIAGLALLLAGTTLFWLATEIAAVASAKDVPDRVTYRSSALAMRSLLTSPGDLAKAWPNTPPHQLPSPTAFWVTFGLLLLLLLVLAAVLFHRWLRWTTTRKAAKSPPDNRNHPLPDGE
jgi:drug/metabolite transporter (DMT)-like permease